MPIEREKQRLLVFGASGHAKVVMDIAEKGGIYTIKWVADDNPALKGRHVYGYFITGGKDMLSADADILRATHAVVAVGNNRIRAEIAAWVCAHGGALSEALVHPSVQLARGAVIGEGSVVMAGAVINADTSIGKNVIVNTGALVDHDCVIGDAVHLAPGVTLCGGIEIGEGSMIGAGAVICPNTHIGRNVTVGAGATVLNDVPDNATVVGTPAKQIG